MLPIQMMYRGARLNGGGEAVISGAVRLTYQDLVMRVEAIAAYLQETVREPQSRIGLCGHNNWMHVATMLGVFASGHIWVPLNPKNSKDELSQIVGAADLALIVADAECLDRFDAGGRPVLVAEGGDRAAGRSVASVIAANTGRKPRDISALADGIAAIKFTGGTTGRPKGVLQPYRAFLSCIASMLTVFDFAQDERMLVPAPLTHGAGTFLLPVMAEGGCTVLVQGAKAPAIVDMMIAEQITASFMPPTLIYALMEVVRQRELRFPALRQLIYGAAPMPPQKVAQAQEIFGPCLAAIYGQTEAPTMIAAISARELADFRNLASVGRPCPYNQVEVMSPEGAILGFGETGEVVVRGDLVMRGYLDLPDATRDTIVAGWLHTGDIGAIDERGYLFLKDRLRDVIISGGFNVYPGDVEAAIATHPEVREVVVFGVEDDYWGQRVEAAVLLKAGAAIGSDALATFAKQLVGPVKAPKRIHFVEDMPRNPVGKVVRREVIGMIAGKRR
ncbi:class I adenylate-forming enzyme family protein [Amorphus sp. MBR-141]